GDGSDVDAVAGGIDDAFDRPGPARAGTGGGEVYHATRRHVAAERILQQQHQRREAHAGEGRGHHGDGAGVELDHAADGIDADALDERLHQRVAEAALRLAVQFGERVRRLHGLAVRAVGSHRVVGVGDADDAHVPRDLVALEPVWITRAVDALVVRADDVARHRRQLVA